MEYYDGSKLMSHQDADIHISVGGRGIGKTYYFKRDCVKRFIEHGEQWIYLRRYGSEFQNIDRLFSDIADEFTDYELTVYRDRMYIKKGEDKRLMGYVMSLSKVKTLKGVNYPLVYSILFDEFQIDTTNKIISKYLNNEVRIFSDFYESVARDRKVRIIMLSNAISQVNPYYLAFKINPKPNTIIKKNLNGLIVVLEMVDSREFMKEKRLTRSGKLMMATNMGVSSLENEYLNDSDVFVKKRPPESFFRFNICYDGRTYGVWMVCGKAGDEIYISPDHQPECKRTYCVKKDDFNEKNIYVTTWRDCFDLKFLKHYFSINKIYYHNQITKFACFEFFTIINLL